MDEDVKLDEDATQKIDETEVAGETPALTNRPRVRMKTRKKAPAVARLTTTPSSTPLDETTVPSEELPMEHRFGQGIDLEMADIVRDDIDLTVKSAEISRPRFRSRSRVRSQNGITLGGRTNSDGADEGEGEDVIRLKWRHSSPPLPSATTEGKPRKSIKHRLEYPVIVCDDPNDCPTPIYDNPPAVYEFGGKKKAAGIIPPAHNVKQGSRGKRPVSGEGRRRFKPFKRKKVSPGNGMRRRNNSTPQQSVSGGAESGPLVVPQRMRVKDFAKDELARKRASLKSKMRKKTMRRKMRPVVQAARVTQTTMVPTTTEENGEGDETGVRNRPMRPFRRRRPTTSPFEVMDGGGAGEDQQVAEETTTQHVPLDMVLMRDMSLPELQEFMANKVKEMNKKMKRVMKGHMEPKGDSISASMPRRKVATPAPTALASTTSYPAVPKMDLRRTTSRGKIPADGGGGNTMPGRIGDSGILFRDQLRIR